MMKRMVHVKKKIFHIKSYLLNFSILGSRPSNSMIIFFGRLKRNIHNTSKINIKNGDFAVNRYLRFKDNSYGYFEMGYKSEINIEDTFFIHSDCDVILRDNSVLKLGSGYINKGCKIRCHHEIEIGNRVAIGENLYIIDDDSHEIIDESLVPISKRKIRIGDAVWIGANVTILKGVTIGDGSVIAAGSVVNKNVPSNCLAGGIPVKILKENISWK